MNISDALKLMREANDLIDSGGCGIAALSAIRWAKKNGVEKEIGIVFLYDSFEEEAAESNMSLIADGHIPDAHTPSHIALLVDGEVIDSRGCPLYMYDCMHSGVTPEGLLSLINNGNWNSWFVRSYGIPLIEQQLCIDLSDIQIK